MAETVDIAVPEEWVGEVYALLAQLAKRKYGVPAGVPAQQSASPEVLDAELIERMYRESLAPHKQLMRFLAEHSEQWWSTEQLAAELKLQKGSKALAGMLGAFSRRSKNRYHGLAPWESRWVAEAEHSEHRMSASVAQVLKTLTEAEQAAAKARRDAKVVTLTESSTR